MRTLKVNDSHSSHEIQNKIREIKNYNDVIDWKIIECVKNNPGIEASEIAKVLGLSIQKIYKVIQNYNKQNSNYKQNLQWGGRRQKTSYLSYESEQAILDSFKKKALKGLIITAKDVKTEFEKVIGKTVSEDYIWKVFKRHNWTKKTPRPEHPKSDASKQEDFKKNSMRIWQPSV